VSFYAVNQRETPETIRGFLGARELKIDVALDKDGAVAGSYEVEGIPQTVIIDKSGKIAAVHVGFSEDLEQRLTAELDALLAGKSISGKPAKEPGMTGLELAWKLDGRFCGIAADVRKDSAWLYALTATGTCAKVDPDGDRDDGFKIEGARSFIRAANLAGDAARELVSFESWGPEVRATDAAGNPLWKYGGGQGVDDVWCADLDSDGRDEVIVGYNGATGLHVLGGDGKLRWKATDIRNVWHVAAGPVLGDGAMQVITTSAAGQVHIFDRDGKAVKTLDPGIYANMVRVGEAAPGGAAPIFVGGAGDEQLEIRALAADGTVRWKTPVGAVSGHVDAMAAAPGKPWLAAALRGGRVVVLDIATGKILGEAKGEPTRSEIAWMPAGTLLIGDDRPKRAGEAPPVLVVTYPTALRAYSLAE
jgi:hypothetical protein